MSTLLGGLLIAQPGKASAYSNSNMMDNGVFNNVNAMGSAATSLSNAPASDYRQVTAFLKANDGRLTAASPCLANYMTQNWYYDGTNFHFGNDSDWNQAWGPAQVPAAQLIYTSARMWGINPQVLLATLQKEQSLVTGTDCSGWRYNSAMGYGCPDSGGCNPRYAGLTKQVFWGAWQLMFSAQRAENNLSWLGNGDITYVGFFSNGTNQSLPYKRCNSCAVLPNAYTTPATIDGQTITIANGATASLYTYTPHLNQSFPGIFERWFGSVFFRGDDPVGSLDVVKPVVGGIRLSGWGLDRSQTAPAAVHFYVNDRFSSAIAADIPRSDIAQRYPENGANHGFDATIPWTQPGVYTICAWVIGDNKGAPNAGLGCRQFTFNSDTAGSLDVVKATPGGARVAGWGLDNGQSGSVPVHFYANGRFASAVSADQYRADVGQHAYDAIIPLSSAGQQQICAWVVGDSAGTPNAGLGCRTILYNPDPSGSFDLAAKAANGVRVAGWALDGSTVAPASVHVYINNVWQGAYAANFNRSDIGSRAFDVVIPWNTPGGQRVCLWAVGDQVGAPNAGLGCRNVVF